MSLGLNDLKKRQVKAPKESPAQTDITNGTGAWSKPWTTAELAQTRISKEKKTAPNLNSDWTLLYAGPVFWVDWSELTWLARTQSRLSFIERQADRSVLRPIRNLRRFMRF